MKVSVITASYNYADHIKETIESVLAQTYPNWELIIVDDGSQDNSVKVINHYCAKDNRIKLFQHEGGINRGLKDTVLLGIEKAGADWIIFLESDDTIAPDYIEKKLSILKKHPSIKFIFNDVNMFGDHEVIRGFDEHFAKANNILRNMTFPSNLLSAFEKRNVVPTFSVVMLKKELFAGLDFNCPLKSSIDWYLWAQIAQYNDFYFLDEKLTNWRMHKKSYMNSPESKLIRNKLDFELKILNFTIKEKSYIKYIFLSCRKQIQYFRRKILRICLRDGELEICGRRIQL